jgi:hypothetical protein
MLAELSQNQFCHPHYLWCVQHVVTSIWASWWKNGRFGSYSTVVCFRKYFFEGNTNDTQHGR